MIKYIDKEDFFTVNSSTTKKVILYGFGMIGKLILPYLNKIDYICDKEIEASLKKDYCGIPLISIKQLENLSGELQILVCVKSKIASSEICRMFENMELNAEIMTYVDNIAFLNKVTKEMPSVGKINKIRLICIDEGWIFNKFAVKMQEELNKKGIEVTIAKYPDLSADINHYIPSHMYQAIEGSKDTLMITHVDSEEKFQLINQQLKVAKMGICMSKETLDKLVDYGINRSKLCYINPPQDQDLEPKKYVLGLTFKADRRDHRMRQSALIDIAEKLDSDYFKFKIMGTGWKIYVETLLKLGYEVEYHPEFDKIIYRNLIESLDYYVYWGFDEGNMGFLDAVAAGIDTIVTPQGYHLDIKGGITFPCRTTEDFIDVLLKIQEKRKRKVEIMKLYSWESYVKKHLDVWNYICENDISNVYEEQHNYEDGFFSVLQYEL